MNGSTSRIARIVLTNETEGHRFAEFEEQLADDLTMGMLYRIYQAEYGRCLSKVYVDGWTNETTPAGAKAIGWYFEKRDRYDEGQGDSYLRGAWVTIHSPVLADGSTSTSEQGEVL